MYNCIHTFGQPSIIGNKLTEFTRQTCRETTINNLNGFILFNTVYGHLAIVRLHSFKMNETTEVGYGIQKEL